MVDATGSGLLDALPALAGVSLFVFDEHGAVVARTGTGKAPQVVRNAGRPAVRAAGRRAVTVPLPDDGLLVATLGSRSAVPPEFVAALLETVVQRAQLEQDMESMNSSSLQLLEQISALGDTLPRLSASASDEEVTATGVRAALAAAGVERAVFVRYFAENGTCEVAGHAIMDGAGQAVSRPYPLEELRPPLAGVLADVLASPDSVVQVAVPKGGRLGGRGSPEGLARTELLAVPVGYGTGDKRVLLGVLLLMDLSATGWNTRDRLGSEEGQVALSFAGMLGAVLGARKTAALGKELSMAQAIQAQILPSSAAVVPGFDLAGDYRTCGEVGGDYFDYVCLADGRTLVVIADVSGHNLASGMMMVSARATLRTLAGKVGDPARLFDELAGALYRDLTQTERFITAAGIALRPGEPRTIEVVNAGHNEPMLYRRARHAIECIPTGDTVLGFLPTARHAPTELQLDPGDFVCLYTDGVTETTDDSGEMFGEQRLQEVLLQHANGSAAAILAAMLAAVAAFRGGNARGDDVTAVVIKATDHGGSA